MKTNLLASALIGLSLAASVYGSDGPQEYRLLATNKTSTMEKELNENAASGFRFETTMGGQSAYGGKEVIVIMSRPASEAPAETYTYKLLATKKTGTMQKELQEAGLDGFEYKGQTVFQTAFGGKEVVVILERSSQKPLARRFDYKILATNKTSTMQKELQEAASEGFTLDGLSVGDTAFGGKEIVTILRKEVTP